MQISGNFLRGYTATYESTALWFSQKYQLLDWLRRIQKPIPEGAR